MTSAPPGRPRPALRVVVTAALATGAFAAAALTGADAAAANAADRPSGRVRVDRPPAPVAVADASFEQVPAGATWFKGSPEGWSGPTLVTVPDPRAYPVGAADPTRRWHGRHVLTLLGVPGQVAVQTTGEVVRPGVVYTLTAAVGGRAGGARFGGARLALYAGGHRVAVRDVAVAPVQAGFGDVALRWTGTAEQAGRRLGVGVGQGVVASSPSTVTDLDRVRVSAAGAALPPTRLLVTAPAAGQVVQRGPDGTAAVTVAVTAAEPAGLLARLRVRPGNRGVTTDWRPLAATGVRTASGRFGGVAAGWYDVEVGARAAAADPGDPEGSAAVTVDAVLQRVGVGEVFVVAGQSNSANHGGPRQSPADQRVSAPTRGYGGWQPAADPQPNATGTGGSPWPAFGSLVAQSHDVPVGVVAVGYGGTTVAMWQPGGVLYPRLRAAITALGADGFRAVLWHQGEADGTGCTSTADYAARLAAVVGRSRADAGSAVPWGVATASTMPASSPACQAAVAAGQALVVAGVPGTFAGPDTDSYRARGWTLDRVHFNAAGLDAHARGWLAAVEAAGLLPAD